MLSIGAKSKGKIFNVFNISQVSDTVPRIISTLEHLLSQQRKQSLILSPDILKHL